MKILSWAAVAATLFLFGCSHDNQLAKAQADRDIAFANAKVAEAQAAAEEARAVQKLADKIDAGGASAYLIAKALKGLNIGGQAPQAVQVSAPASPLALAWQTVLQVADVGLRAWGFKINRDVAIHTSDNNRDVSIASYQAFQGMGQSIASTGVAGINGIRDVGIATAQALPALQPNITTTTTTLSGQGVIGSGSYVGPVTTTHNCQGGTAGTGAAGGLGGAGGGTTGAAGAGAAGGAGGNAPGGIC